MIDVPDHLMAAPEVPAASAAELDAILATVLASGSADDGPVDLTGATDRPVWQLLARAGASGRFAIHGSGSDDITEFEPRQSNDTHEFGNRRGVYAAADGLWPYYFAIVDRARVRSLVNAAGFVVDPDSGVETGPYYFFSIESDDGAPWREGTVYLLPIEGFEREGEQHRRGLLTRSTQLFVPHAVRPLARVRVSPDGFPFLRDIRRHTSDVLSRAATDPDGFPWL